MGWKDKSLDFIGPDVDAVSDILGLMTGKSVADQKDLVLGVGEDKLTAFIRPARPIKRNSPRRLTAKIRGSVKRAPLLVMTDIRPVGIQGAPA